MNINTTKFQLINLIKMLSIILISSAICLELWNIYQFSNNRTIPSILSPIVWTERFAVTIHLFEGVIAGIYAPSKNKLPLQYGVYTFFVGTVGLVELFRQKDKLSDQ